jgi:hypothetical protein
MSLLCSMLHVSIHSKVTAIQNSTEAISYLCQLSLLFPLHYIIHKIIHVCVCVCVCVYSGVNSVSSVIQLAKNSTYQTFLHKIKLACP